MRFLSVCSGIEAASVAWGPLGWKAVAFSEIEPFPCALLAHHYPGVPNLGDMTKFQEWPDLAVDLLCGGTPCQSFSVAGLRKGLDDPRGNLMLTFGAIAARYRPRWLVWENVPGVLSSNGGRDFGSFLGMLGQLGYGFAYRVLDAQFFGVAQRRRRVFVVGCLGDWRSAAAVLFERHSLQGHPAPSRETGQRAAGAVVARAGRNGGASNQDVDGGALVAHSLRGEGFDASEDGPGRGTPLVPVAFAATDYEQGAFDEVDQAAPLTTSADRTRAAPILAFSAKDYGADAQEDLSPTLRAGGHANSHANAGVMPAIAFDTYNQVETGDVTQTLCSRGDSPGGNAHLVPAVAFQERGREDGRSLEVGGEVAYALTAPKDGGRAQERNVLTPTMQVRRLTPVECARLQGFPDTYLDITYRGKPAADGPKYKALGNSWAVPNVRWIGRRIALVDTIRARTEVIAA